jgi:predicted kinase
MTEKTLYILRSVSGAGKTTLAKAWEESLPNSVAIAADDYWYDKEGNYNFDITRLGDAHKNCQFKVKRAMMVLKRDNIIVHNTNTSEKEIKPYLELADMFGYKVVSLVVENRHGNKNVHDVPDFVLERQENNLRNSIKLS